MPVWDLFEDFITYQSAGLGDRVQRALANAKREFVIAFAEFRAAYLREV